MILDSILSDYSNYLTESDIDHLSSTYNGSSMSVKQAVVDTTSIIKLVLTNDYSEVYLVLHTESSEEYSGWRDYSRIPTTHILREVDLVESTDRYSVYTKTPGMVEVSQFEELDYSSALELLKDYRFQFREMLRQLHYDSSSYLSEDSKYSHYFDNYPSIRSLPNYPPSSTYSESKSRLIHIESIVLELQDKYCNLSLNTPCNNMMTIDNLVITPDRVSILSWEFSSINDPSYDYAKILLSPQVDTAKNYSSILNNLLIDLVDRDSDDRKIVDPNFRLKLLIAMILIDYEDCCKILSSSDPKDYSVSDYERVSLRLSRMEKFVIESRTSLSRFLNIHIPGGK